MNKWEREFKIAELIAESEEQRRFDEFYEKIPELAVRHKTQESHLPLIFVSSAEGKYGLNHMDGLRRKNGK